MEENRYEVLIDNMVVAENMDLKTATILVKALFEEYYNDYKMEVSVRKINKESDNNIYDSYKLKERVVV